MEAGGGGGGHISWGKMRECARKIILARDLLRQSEAQSQITIRITVPQGSVKEIFVDHAGVEPHDRDRNPDVDPYKYVLNGFLQYLFHASTQILESA